jgi:organic radical activating enzyme
VVPLNRPVTILGGEPFIQPEALAVLTDFLQQYDLHTMVYSGYTFEDLAAMRYKIPSIYNIFSNIDVLVDGPYIQAMNDDMVQWRGSKNQRAIDMRRTWGFRIEPVLLDWDRRQTITILENGDILATKGLIALLAEEGDVVERNRQCGEPHHGR